MWRSSWRREGERDDRNDGQSDHEEPRRRETLPVAIRVVSMNKLWLDQVSAPLHNMCNNDGAVAEAAIEPFNAAGGRNDQEMITDDSPSRSAGRKVARRSAGRGGEPGVCHSRRDIAGR
jgi:hypothetical protein